jgi:glycosyltransferase involved in cell wall biosynthesis
MKPLITLGITCYNAEDTIELAVRSAIAQDWGNVEIIVVDDASNDGSYKILEQLQKEDTRIRLIRHEENQGYPSSLNTIIEHANGDFIAIFDDDDLSSPDRLTCQYERLVTYEKESGSDKVVCYCNRLAIAVNGETQPVLAIGRNGVAPFGVMVADFLFFEKKVPGYTFGQFGSCTLFARKTIFRFAGNFDPDFRRCAEWDWAVRLAFLGGHFIAVDKPLVTQRITLSSDKANRIPLYYAIKLRQKYKTYLKQNNMYALSIIMAYVKYYYAKKMRWRFRFALLTALVVGPRATVEHIRAARKSGSGR